MKRKQVCSVVQWRFESFWHDLCHPFHQADLSRSATARQVKSLVPWSQPLWLSRRHGYVGALWLGRRRGMRREIRALTFCLSSKSLFEFIYCIHYWKKGKWSSGFLVLWTSFRDLCQSLAPFGRSWRNVGDRRFVVSYSLAEVNSQRRHRHPRPPLPSNVKPARLARQLEVVKTMEMLCAHMIMICLPRTWSGFHSRRSSCKSVRIVKRNRTIFFDIKSNPSKST